MYIWAIILKLIFLKNEAASGKSPFNLSYVWKCCAFIRCSLNQKALLQLFKKSFSCSETLFQSQGIEGAKNPQ